MDTTQLAEIIGLLVALSVASERFVEIVKGFFETLNKPKASGSKEEGRRRAVLQGLAVVSGIITAFFARPAIPAGLIPPNSGWVLPTIALGLLASGGSGFWNAVLGYVLNVKDLKKFEVRELERKGKEGLESPDARGEDDSGVAGSEG